MRTAQAAPGRRFQRRVEDFACARCGERNRGDGYTNHCRRCLWSRHVDRRPGDRAADCGGMMEPVGVETGGGRTKIIHRCAECGHLSRCRISPGDDWAAVTAASNSVGRAGAGRKG